MATSVPTQSSVGLVQVMCALVVLAGTTALVAALALVVSNVPAQSWVDMWQWMAAIPTWKW